VTLDKILLDDVPILPVAELKFKLLAIRRCVASVILPEPPAVILIVPLLAFTLPPIAMLPFELVVKLNRSPLPTEEAASVPLPLLVT